MKIIQGDCLEKMAELEDNSIDTIITDPPYGLSFMGKKWDYDVPSIEIWKECLRVLKPGGTALIFAGSRTQHRMAVNVEDAGFELKDCIMWLYGSGFPKATDISKQLDKGHERRVIGKMSEIHPRYKTPRKGAEGYGNIISSKEDPDITEPATEEAKLWNGWKSHGLKPAYEPILVAVKPNDGTYANNALKWGVSGLNIDGGRIGTEEMGGGTMPDLRDVGAMSKENTGIDKLSFGQNHRPAERKEQAKYTGRFPANILLDEEVAKNAGGWSRYFYVAKASKSERNAGCEGLDEKFSSASEFRPNHMEKTLNGDDGNPYGRWKPLKNNHPTVKPLKLMEYLCTLTKTPTGGIVLDPFAGSGTTGLACQNTGRDYILIEREEEYIPIIKARLNQKQQTLI